MQILFDLKSFRRLSLNKILLIIEPFIQFDDFYFINRKSRNKFRKRKSRKYLYKDLTRVQT